MLEYKTAIDLMLSTVKKLPAGTVELNQALHRILAEDIFYDTDMPPFNKSAMDGYACR
ncbi:MAG: molybdopterin molybdenumtransferase MoeA, partial [Bacteroidota bacterium]